MDLDVTTVNYPFLSTPSARRATLLLPLTAARSSIFLSTPSARRATHPALRRHRILRISIHALREEGDLLTCCSRSSRQCISIHALREEGDFRSRVLHRFCPISIHALREEGDGTPMPGNGAPSAFLSTPSARRATPDRFRAEQAQAISIHALREEGDLLPECLSPEL